MFKNVKAYYCTCHHVIAQEISMFCAGYADQSWLFLVITSSGDEKQHRDLADRLRNLTVSGLQLS